MPFRDGPLPNGDSASVSEPLPSIGLEPNERGQLQVDEHFQTKLPHIHALGEVIGFPSLASAAYVQGRYAACRIFGTGHTVGMLKILFHLETHKILGVHCLGEGASELIHIGQAVMALGGTVEYFRDNVFNYPTLAECYKVAALDGLNKLSLWEEAESVCAEIAPAMDIATEAIQAAVLV